MSPGAGGAAAREAERLIAKLYEGRWHISVLMRSEIAAETRALVAAVATLAAERDGLKAEVERLTSVRWICSTCGASFQKLPLLPNGVDPQEGITRCSKCVEAEVLSYHLGKTRHERDEAEAALRWCADLLQHGCTDFEITHALQLEAVARARAREAKP